jgi:integrase
MSTGADDRRRDIATGVNIERGDTDIRQSALDALSGPQASGHARDDALTSKEFEQLVDASYGIKNDRMEVECRALLYLAGRVGLRKGEIAHLSGEWIDWSDGTITVPEHDPCEKGQHDNEPCGYCRGRAEDRVETAAITHDEAVDAIRHVLEEPGNVNDEVINAEAKELREDVSITIESALDGQWQPKTPASAREIPFDFDVRADLALRELAEVSDGWERSAATVNRRINRVAERSDVDGRVYPHALRATAASYHASRDISIHSLMSMLGWSDPSTARTYVTGSADSAAREVRSKHR